MPIESVIRNRTNRVKRAQNKSPDLAALGISDDPNAAVFVNDQPGYWWVRPIQAGGTFGPPVKVRGCMIPMSVTPGDMVHLGKQGGERVVLGPDFDSALVKNVNPTQNAVNDPNANKQSFVNQAFIATAFQQIVEGTLKVGVRGSVPLVAGVFVKVEGQIDFTGNVPTTGEHCVAATAVLSDLSGFETQYSTPKSLLIPLDIDDLNEAWALMSDPLTNKPLWAWDIGNGQTALVESNRWLDIRQFLNWETSGGGTGTVTDVTWVTHDGVSASIATSTTTPAITPSLGAITPDSVAAKGTAGAGFYEDVAQSSDPSAPAATGLRLFADASGYLAWRVKNGSDTFKRLFNGVLTAARSYTWPDKSGTVAMTSDIPSLIGPAYILMCDAIATSNVSLSTPGSTFNGVTLTSAGVQRLFLQGQTAGAENGPYVWNGASSALTRPTDYPSGGTVYAYYNVIVAIKSSVTAIGNGLSLWYLTTTSAVTIDTTATSWTFLVYNAEVISGTLPVGHGGTGAATLTAHAALIGNGTGTITTLAPGTARNVMISDSTDWTSRAIQDADLPTALAGHTITGGTINNTPIGGTTPAAGTFTTFKIQVGGFNATITHAFTADRTVTLPGDANVTLVGLDTTQTLTNKTLTTPTIADFTNATHNHQNAAGGGTLDGAAIAAGTVAAARLPLYLMQSALINGGFSLWSRQAITPTTLTSYSDDTYSGADLWYVLTQTASVQNARVAGDTNSDFAAELKQNQASAQRMGYAQIIEGLVAKTYRSKSVRFQARVKISNSQAVRIAIVEWTGTEDTPTSDIVNDWTSSTYTTGNFFISTTTTVTAVAAVTPSAATWTDISVTGTISSSANNIIVFIWTEGTAAQNVTLDIAEIGFYEGGNSVPWQPPDPTYESLRAQRFLKVFNSPNGSATVVLNGYSITNTTGRHPYIPPVPFITLPALTATPGDWDSSVNGAVTAVTAISVLAGSTVTSVTLLVTAGAGGTSVSKTLQGDAAADRYLILSAEL